MVKNEVVYTLTTLYAKLHGKFQWQKQTYEKPNDGPMKKPNSTLFANIVSNLRPAQTLSRAKVFCKNLGPAEVFCEKFEST